MANLLRKATARLIVAPAGTTPAPWTPMNGARVILPFLHFDGSIAHQQGLAFNERLGQLCSRTNQDSAEGDP
jgi:hypothetical protein